MKAPGAVSTSLTFLSYAKINLYLKVLGRRDDGYHNIETIFQTIDLSDELRFTLRPSDISLECTALDVPAGSENLAWRAAALLKKKCDCDRGIHIELKKRIPAAAGLAGGSGNAAATLTALNQLWNLELSEIELRELGLELGSDVPYCTVGGTMAATGRGEALSALDALPETAFLVLHPQIQVSTARVFNHPLLPRSSERPIDSMTADLKIAVGMLKKGAIADVLQNDMESVVFAENPELAVLKQRLLDAGCAAALMSGSGSSIFGICKHRDHAREIAGSFPELNTSIAASVPHGVQRIE